MEPKVFVVIDTDTVRLSETFKILQDFGKAYDVQRPQEMIQILELEERIDAVFVSSQIPNLKDVIDNIMKITSSSSVYVIGDIDPDLLSELFFLGVRDALSHPLSPRDIGLHRKITDLYLRGEGKQIYVDFDTTPMTREKFIMVCSAKGGVGKSVIAVQIGAVLAKLTGQAILIDGDYTGNAQRIAGLAGHNSIAEFEEDKMQSIDRENLEQRLVTHVKSGLKILPSPVNVMTAIPVNMLRNAIVAYRRFYSMVVVDLPTGYNPSVDFAKDYATDIIVVFDNDMRQLERNREFIGKLISRGVDPKKIHIVVNKAQSGSDAIRYVLKEHDIEDEVSIHHLPFSNDFQKEELPVFQDEKRSYYSRSIREFMRDIGIRGKKTEELTDGGSSLFINFKSFFKKHLLGGK